MVCVILLIQTVRSTTTARLWLTSTRFYRSGADDGLIYATLLAPLTLFANIIRIAHHDSSSLMILYLFNAVELSFLSSIITLCHAIITKLELLPNRISNHLSFIISVIFFPLGLAYLVSTIAYLFFPLFSQTPFYQIFISIATFHISAYCTIVLLRRSFTFAEMILLANGLAAVTYEAINLTLFKLHFYQYPPWLTFERHPISIFVVALTLGMSLIGFLSWPILIVSRRRAMLTLRKRQLYPPRWYHFDKALAAILFYGFTFFFVLFCIRPWVQAFLPNHEDPFLFVLKFVFTGIKIRMVLIVTWIISILASILLLIQITGKSKIINQRKSVYADTSDEDEDTTQSSLIKENTIGLKHASMFLSSDTESRDLPSPLLHDGESTSTSSMSNIGPRKMLSHPSSSFRIDKHPLPARKLSTIKFVSTSSQKAIFNFFTKSGILSSVNSRRKYFHFLAIFLFSPGIIYDPLFTCLAFGVAFAGFIFVEYVRFFALWPAGRYVHIFLISFQDIKEQGVIILAHFYLLVGCGIPLMLACISDIDSKNHLETSLLALSGVLTLGLGDSMASIIGKRFGRHGWPKSNKTIEGSIAFVTFVLIGIGFVTLMIQGWTSLWNYSLIFKYLILIIFCALLEANVLQNDNIIIPLVYYDLCICMGICT